MSDQRIPVPDPTELTTEALRRDIGALESLIDVKLDQLQSAIENLEKLHDRVFKERDRRYGERFDAAEDAVATALQAARESAARAVSAQEQAFAAAFESSEKAILKAESSIEKRADATYTSLARLQEVLGEVMSRKEADQRFNDLLDRIQSNANRVTQIEAMRTGAKEDRTGLYATVGLGISALLALIAVIGFMATTGAFG